MTQVSPFVIIEETMTRFISLFKDKENIRSLAEVFTPLMEELQDVFFDLLEQMNIEDANAAQLDVIGTILDEARNGRNDDDYRQLLKLKIFINTSDGTEQAVSDAVKALTQATEVTLTEAFPAGLNVETNGVVTDQDTLDSIQNVVAACIEVSTIPQVDNPFVFSDTDGISIFDDPSGEGFTDVAFTGGPEDPIGGTVVDRIGF